MPKTLLIRVALAALAPLALACSHRGAAHPQHEMPGPAEQPAQLFEGLGQHHHAVSTQVPEAQRYFDQGLTLLFAFNHDEAIRSFNQAGQLDPRCAMAFWGVALANGPHINNPTLDPDHAKAAWAALQKARQLASGASPLERDYIEALAKRYAADPGAERAPLDQAYANAMRALARAHPDDTDAATLFAEAMMDLRPWDLWTQDGKPQPGTDEVLGALEAVLARDPEHPGANHFYIHAVEASPHPEKALAAADRLGAGLVPAAGHLVHMPAHIYIRVGRYEDASEANRRAIAADRAYVAKAGRQGFYTMYKAHNFQFLWASAMMEGRSAESIQAGRDMVAQVPPPMIEAMADMVDGSMAAPILTLARFGRWDQVLAEPAPNPKLRVTSALWHYTRGLARAARGQIEEATREQRELSKLARGLDDKAMAGMSPGKTVVGIASDVLAAELALRRGHAAEAIRLLEGAVKAEDTLHYDEPPDWYQPVRQILGAVLLKAGRAREAEAVYRADLGRNPENGWSLFGLMQALRARRAEAEAAAVGQRFEKAWAHADVKLTESRF
ncbi:MAG TPA: hypothetical protein VKN99_19345 [Polyangia bacterium]|nr:hypothetical protein [Polyangia bacterium]